MHHKSALGSVMEKYTQYYLFELIQSSSYEQT